MKRDLPMPSDSDDARWAAVQGRDASLDGRFFYAVATTGVYCRPSCGARLARRENVTFHPTAADAERAGDHLDRDRHPEHEPWIHVFSDSM